VYRFDKLSSDNDDISSIRLATGGKNNLSIVLPNTNGYRIEIMSRYYRDSESVVLQQI
jgi:hypothetical protein